MQKALYLFYNSTQTSEQVLYKNGQNNKQNIKSFCNGNCKHFIISENINFFHRFPFLRYLLGRNCSGCQGTYYRQTKLLSVKCELTHYLIVITFNKKC